MPGKNCAFVECHVYRKKGGYSIFNVPKGEDEWSTNWRKQLIDIITKYRVVDAKFRCQIEKKEVSICERHFTEDLKIQHASGKKTLRPGALPTLAFPEKSFPPAVIVPRQSATSINEKRLVSSPICVGPSQPYSSFEEFKNKISDLKLESYGVQHCLKYTRIFKFDLIHSVPFIEIYVQESLDYSIRVYSWNIPASHQIYEYSLKKDLTLSSLIKIINSYVLCSGMVNKILKESAIFLHAIPKHYDPGQSSLSLSQSPLHQTTYYRSASCYVLCNSEGGSCNNCSTEDKKQDKSKKRNVDSQTKPAEDKAPLSQTSTERIRLKLHNFRLENKELKEQLLKLHEEIKSSAVEVGSELSKDFISVISNSNKPMPEFMKLFWNEQQKYLNKSSTKGVRYHPMIIRYCLSLVAKSPAVYDELRFDENNNSGVLILPSRRRLRDYKNYIRPERGFNPLIIKELINKVKEFSEIEKFMILLMDEMKIQENLVWDKHTGELIGFVDLGDVDINYTVLQEPNKLASHVLVFLIRSIVNPFKFSLANFATTSATCTQMFLLVWKAISICELNNIKIVGLTCDGASHNRKMFKMHSQMTEDEDKNPNVDVTYRITNISSVDKRYI